MANPKDKEQKKSIDIAIDWTNRAAKTLKGKWEERKARKLRELESDPEEQMIREDARNLQETYELNKPVDWHDQAIEEQAIGRAASEQDKAKEPVQLSQKAREKLSRDSATRQRADEKARGALSGYEFSIESPNKKKK